MFLNELQYCLAYLGDARSMVMTSFFSHRTISHLDLQISQRALYYRRGLSRGFYRGNLLLEKSFFCTEESFRNAVVPKRRLLYTLNLDFPDGREYSYLRNGSTPDSLPLNDESIFVAVRGCDCFFQNALANLIEPALEKTDCKFKLLKWMADFPPLESVFIPLPAQYSCAMILYRECVDSEFATKFFGTFIHLYAFPSTGEEILEYLLYHTRLCDFDVRSQKCCRSSLTDYCIERLGFRLVHSFLKYEDTVYYTEESYEGYKWSIYYNIIQEIEKEELSRPENQMSKLRLYRMLQIIHIFQYHEYDELKRDAPEALRLVWRSIPDCFVSLQEMKDAYEDVLTSEVLSRAHGFYEETISQTVSWREPRSLAQYCRSAVRKSLYNSKQWLPDGIKLLKLPPRIESFLNLQRDNLRIENFQPL